MFQLFNDDAIKILKQLPDESIDLIITDPPYRTTSRGCSGNSGGIFAEEINKKGKVFEHNDINITCWLPELYRVLKEGTHCYIMTNNVNLKHYLNIIDEVGFHFTKDLIWVKNSKSNGQFYMGQMEHILFCRKGKAKRINNCGTSDVLMINNVIGKNKTHPTEKPVELWDILISNSSNEGDLVMDPFVGSGSAGVSAVKLNRDFIGIELDKQYFDIAKERIENVSVV